MSFLLVLTASIFGSAIGVTSVFVIMGLLARRLERKQAELIREQQKAFLEKRQKDQERMEWYARMES